MITRRRFATGTALAAGLGLTATACSTSEGTPEGPVTLRMTVWTAEDEHLALFQEIAEEYVQAHPETVSGVTFETIPFDDYTTALTTQLSGGNSPDLAWIFESSAPEFVQSGALVEIGETLEGDAEYDYADIDPATLGLWESEDGLFAYPFSNSPFCMFLNTTRLEEAGQDDLLAAFEAGEWTYALALQVSADTVEELGGAGFVVRDFDYAGWENLASVYAGFGAEAWSEDGSTCGFARSEMVEAMSVLHEAAFETAAMPGPGDEVDFFAGQATMIITQISRASSLDDSFDWEVLPLPAGPATQRNVVGQAGIGVLAEGQAPEVAADFLAHFTSPASAAKLARFFPPPRRSLLEVDTLAEGNPQFSPEQLQRVVIDGIVDSITKPSHVRFAELQSTVRSAMDPLWTAGADVQGVLDEVCSSIQPLLDA